MEKIYLNGYVKDTNSDPRNYNISQFIPKVDIIPDEEFTLNLPKMDIIIDQGRISSCVGHAFAMAKSILEYNQSNKWIDFDPYLIYGTRFYGEYTGTGMIPKQGANALYKEGAYLRRDFGIAQEMPQIMTTVEAWKRDNPEKVMDAAKYKITGYSYLHSIDAIKLALKNGMPVCGAWEIFDSFYRTGNDGVVQTPKTGERSYGFHEMTIVGWTNNNEWIVVNSWGIKYGFKGVYLIPFNYKYDSAISVSDTIIPTTNKAGEIKFQINNPKYTVDGVEKEFDSAPYIRNNRTYVPARFITESLGSSVEWIENTQQVIVRSEEAVIKMTINSPTITVNNNTINIDAAPEITNNRTMIPIRVISEYLNCEVSYNEEDKSILIKSL